MHLDRLLAFIEAVLLEEQVVPGGLQWHQVSATGFWATSHLDARKSNIPNISNSVRDKTASRSGVGDAA